MHLGSSWFPQVSLVSFCKIVNNSLLFAFCFVNCNAMLLQCNMYQCYFHCTPGLYACFFCDYFCKKCITNFKQVEPFTQMPCQQVFTQRRHSRTLHSIFMSDGKLNATGCCSELSLLFTCIPFILGSQRAFNVGRSVVLFL